MNDLRYSVMKDYGFENERKKKTDIGKILFQIEYAKRELNYYIKDLETTYDDYEEELNDIILHPIECVPERQSIEAYRLEIQKLESLIDEKIHFIRSSTEKARVHFDEMGKEFRIFMKNHFDLLSSELDAISTLPQEEAVIIPDTEIKNTNEQMKMEMEVEEENFNENMNQNISLDIPQNPSIDIPSNSSLSSSLPPSPTSSSSLNTLEIQQQQQQQQTNINNNNQHHHQQQQSQQQQHQSIEPILYDENKPLDENIKLLLTSKLKLAEDGDYCICHYSGDGPMIGCDGECGNWYHKSCLGIDKVPSKAQWICPFCKLDREKKIEMEERENQQRKQDIDKKEKGKI